MFLAVIIKFWISKRIPLIFRDSFWSLWIWNIGKPGLVLKSPLGSLPSTSRWIWPFPHFPLILRRSYNSGFCLHREIQLKEDRRVSRDGRKAAAGSRISSCLSPGLGFGDMIQSFTIQTSGNYSILLLF